MKKIITAFSALLIVSIGFWACRKQDYSFKEADNALTVEKFFTLPNNASPEIMRIAARLKQLNDKTGFIADLVHREGLAIWDKSIYNTAKNHSTSVIDVATNSINTNANGTSNNDTIVYIPLVLQNADYVNAFIYATLNGDIRLKLYRAKEYANREFGDLQGKANNADHFALQMMLLNEKVFGYTEFRLKDSRLFKNLTAVAKGADDKNRTLKLTTSNTSQSTSGIKLMGWEHIDVTVCVTTTSYNCATPNWPGCQPVCDASYHECVKCTKDVSTSCQTTTYSYFVEPKETPQPPLGSTDGGGGTPITGNPAPSGPVQCNPTPELDNGLLPCEKGNTTGWTIVPSKSVSAYDPMIADSVVIDTSITNNYPCFSKIIDTLSSFSNLNQKAQVALSQIFNTNKRIHTTLKLDRSLVGTSTSAYTKRTGYSTTNASDTAELNFSATIFINPDMLASATKEYIATTVVHESMHAYIDYIFTLYNLQLVDSNYVKAKFPIFWGGINARKTPSEIQQHNLMASNWVKLISDPLYGFTNNELTQPTKDSIYQAIGWGGLYESDAFKGRTDGCYIMAINIAARNMNIGTPYSIVGYPQCSSNYNFTAQSLKLKKPCD